MTCIIGIIFSFYKNTPFVFLTCTSMISKYISIWKYTNCTCAFVFKNAFTVLDQLKFTHTLQYKIGIKGSLENKTMTT